MTKGAKLFFRCLSFVIRHSSFVAGVLAMSFASDDPFLHDWTLYQGKGPLAGIILLILLLIFISGPQRRKIRWPVLFLALHMVLYPLRLPFPPDSLLRGVLRFLASFCFFSA